MSIFKKASKTSIKIRLGMFGPSGAGKTLSSLAIAKELAIVWEQQIESLAKENIHF